MKFHNKFIWLAAIFFIALGALSAQEDVLRPKGKPEGYGDDFFVYGGSPWAVGLEGGVNYNMFKQDQVWFFADGRENPTFNQVFDKANGISPHFAVFVDYSFDSKSAIGLRIGYESRNFGNDITDSATTTFDTKVKTDYEYKFITDWASLNLYYRYSFTPEFFMTVGALFESMNGTPEYEQYLHTYDGTPVSSVAWTTSTNFNSSDDTQRIRNEVDKAFFEQSRTALEIGVGYKFQINSRLSIVPQARFQYFLTPVLKDQITEVNNGVTGELIQRTGFENRQLHGLQLAVALWFNI
ncbi:MAG: outer membrane beta-barrel protein [Chloroflexota bacterium]